MRSILSLILSILFSIVNVSAQPALDFSSLSGGFNFYQGSYSLGWRFTANQNINVSALGFYDDLSDGLAASHEVGIFDVLTCQLIVSTTVTPSDPITGFFRYRDVPTAQLTAGRDYYIAGVTNGNDKYAVGVGTLNVDPAITFWGFAIYGNTQTTSSLLCPNGSAGQQGFRGDFGPTFKIGTGQGATPSPTATPTATPTPSSNKSASAISLFCNRTGVNLGTAKCSVSVADASSTLPKSLPTGVVNFVATSGFFPASGSCNLLQSQYSGSVSSCEAEFSVPVGFPIGTAFPIDAVYPGNSTFAASATAHKLLYASCIESPSTPCANSIGLDFPQTPRVEKNAIGAVVGCSGTLNTKSLHFTAASDAACVLTATSIVELVVVLDGLTPDAFRKIATGISSKDAARDPAFANIRNAAMLSDSQLQLILRTNAVNGIPNNRLAKLISTGKVATKSLNFKATTSKRGQTKIVIGTIATSLKANSQKTVKFKLSAIAKTVIAIFKAAGYEELPLTINISSTRKGQRKPVKSTSTVDVVIK